MENFDVVVIGAGPGGYPAAIRAAQLGASVAIVEKEQLGGTCLNWGCIPSKALIAAADTFARIGHSQFAGISAKEASMDYAALIGHKDKVVRQLQGGIKQLLAANGVKQFSGLASFKDRNTLGIAGGPDLFGRKIIIATGSTSATPGFLPKHERVVESRGFLARSALPKSMLVLGGGFIGCELACMAAMLGVKVTIVELLEDILLLLDPDVRREVRGAMEKNLGIRVLTGKALSQITADDTAVRGQVGEEALTADLLLSAVGRRPVTAGLDLDKRRARDQRAWVHRGGRLLPDPGRKPLRHRRCHWQNPTCPLRHRPRHRGRRKCAAPQAAPARYPGAQCDLHRPRGWHGWTERRRREEVESAG